MDVLDRAVAGDEHHVERDQRVLHPEADRHLLEEVEQHALVGAELLAVHQAMGTLGVGGGHLDVELDLAAGRHDHQRRFLEFDIGFLRASGYGRQAERSTEQDTAAERPRHELERHAPLKHIPFGWDSRTQCASRWHAPRSDGGQPARISTTCRPFWPSAMRTITFCPGASESMPCRRSTAACTKMSPSADSRVTKP